MVFFLLGEFINRAGLVRVCVVMASNWIFGYFEGTLGFLRLFRTSSGLKLLKFLLFFFCGSLFLQMLRDFLLQRREQNLDLSFVKTKVPAKILRPSHGVY